MKDSAIVEAERNYDSHCPGCSYRCKRVNMRTQKKEGGHIDYVTRTPSPLCPEGNSLLRGLLFLKGIDKRALPSAKFDVSVA